MPANHNSNTLPPIIRGLIGALPDGTPSGSERKILHTVSTKRTGAVPPSLRQFVNIDGEKDCLKKPNSWTEKSECKKYMKGFKEWSKKFDDENVGIGEPIETFPGCFNNPEFRKKFNEMQQNIYRINSL